MCLAKDTESASPEKEVASPRSPWAKLLNSQVRFSPSSMLVFK